MPRPTKPACSGSCPEPPPEISATFPGCSSRRRTNLSSAPRETISAWAAANPARLSVSIRSGALMSFFMAIPPDVLLVVAEAGHAARNFSDGFVEQPVAPRVAQIRHREDEFACARRLPDHIEPPRVRFGIRGQKLAPVGGREVEDPKNRPTTRP